MFVIDRKNQSSCSLLGRDPAAITTPGVDFLSVYTDNTAVQYQPREYCSPADNTPEPDDVGSIIARFIPDNTSYPSAAQLDTAATNGSQDNSTVALESQAMNPPRTAPAANISSASQQDNSSQKSLFRSDATIEDIRSVRNIIQNCTENIGFSLYANDRLDTTRYLNSNGYRLYRRYLEETFNHCKNNSDVFTGNFAESFDQDSLYDSFVARVRELGGSISQQQILEMVNTTLQDSLLSPQQQPREIKQSFNKQQQPSTAIAADQSSLQPDVKDDRSAGSVLEDGSIRDPILDLKLSGSNHDDSLRAMSKAWSDSYIAEIRLNSPKHLLTKYNSSDSYSIFKLQLKNIFKYCSYTTKLFSGSIVDSMDESQLHTLYVSCIQGKQDGNTIQEILNCTGTAFQIIVSAPEIRRKALRLQPVYMKAITSASTRDFIDREDKLIFTDPHNSILDVITKLGAIKGDITAMGIQDYFNGKVVPSLTGMEKFIGENSNLPSEQIGKEFKKALALAGSEDTQRILHRLSNYSPELQQPLRRLFDELNPQQQQVLTAGLYVMLGITDDWDDLRQKHQKTTFSNALLVHNRMVSGYNDKEIMQTFPEMFDGLTSVAQFRERCSDIRLNALMLTGLIERNDKICNDIYKMTSGKDMFYNIDAGLQIAVLKAADLIGGNAANYINDTILATDVANQLRDTEAGRWFGGFVRDNITDVIEVIGIAIGAEDYVGVKLTSGIISTTDIFTPSQGALPGTPQRPGQYRYRYCCRHACRDCSYCCA